MTVTTPKPSALAGHKLVLLSPFVLPDDCVPNLKKAYPELEVIAHRQPWDRLTTDLSAEDWKDATILATGSALPEASRGELAPKLQYVQLFSAGVNHLAKHAVFADEKVAFCGANGVHGWGFRLFSLEGFFRLGSGIICWLTVGTDRRLRNGSLPPT